MHGLTQAYPAGNMFGIIVRQALNLDQRLEQFIKDMEKDDALVAIVQAIADWCWALARQRSSHHSVVEAEHELLTRNRLPPDSCQHEHRASKFVMTG
ncbi:hypothetical protein ACP70R_031014 [Stipagrostis hirtigluma subsp. patula]